MVKVDFSKIFSLNKFKPILKKMSSSQQDRLKEILEALIETFKDNSEEINFADFLQPEKAEPSKKLQKTWGDKQSYDLNSSFPYDKLIKMIFSAIQKAPSIESVEIAFNRGFCTDGTMMPFDYERKQYELIQQIITAKQENSPQFTYNNLDYLKNRILFYLQTPNPTHLSHKLDANFGKFVIDNLLPYKVELKKAIINELNPKNKHHKNILNQLKQKQTETPKTSNSLVNEVDLNKSIFDLAQEHMSRQNDNEKLDLDQWDAKKELSKTSNTVDDNTQKSKEVKNDPLELAKKHMWGENYEGENKKSSIPDEKSINNTPKNNNENRKLSPFLIFKPIKSSYSNSKKIVKIPKEFLDPITDEIMRDPIVLPNTGKSCDKKILTDWLANNDTCPYSGVKFRKDENGDHILIQNLTVKNLISDFIEKNKDALLQQDATKDLVEKYLELDESISNSNIQTM